jgi:threonine-phosphate decarboxylase
MGARPVVTHGALDHAELVARGLRPETLLDFSSNVNPFGPPPGVRAALAALDPAPYPDRSYLELRRELATKHGCQLEQIAPGNGSNELIYLLGRALLCSGDDALVVGPTFSEYAYASRLALARVTEWRAQADELFAVDEWAVVEQIQRRRPRLTWLCAPNNPTGVVVSPAQLDAIAAACAANDGVLVVDRTYHALTRHPDPLEHVMTPRSPAVVQLHSLTKSHAIAGLRLGYLLGEAELMARVVAYQPAWSVSSAAQAAGLAALRDAEFLPRTLPQLWAASDALRASLERLGLAVWRGALPFLLVQSGVGAATRAALLARGCVVRDCASFGLPEWVRVAPRRPEENEQLLHAWSALIAEELTR